MHSATQIIAQRAPPATRTKARWQPYYSIPSASSSTSSLPPRSPHINTPNASVSSPLAPTSSSCDLSQSRPSLSATTAQTPRESALRDPTTKHKFAVGLIDQAVNTISEIWRPQDIPRVFQAPPKTTTPLTTTPNQQNFLSKGSSHQSSIPPSTQPSHPAALLATGTDPDQNLLPMKTFIHEVLRRSRTSGSILQAALCYLEAIRSKVPEILREEKMGVRTQYLPDSTILPATPEELEREAELCAMEISLDSQVSDDSMKTIRVTDCGGPDDLDGMHQLDDGDISISSLVAEPSIASSSLSTPSLPSPLLCPRRAFLASLILASKFFQDKCYSNRAWAKLSGLPPREIGRCERAFGQALGWRLWVGKNPVAPQPTVTTAGPIRTIIRSQSEGSILSPSTSNRPFLAHDEPSARSGLRRCSTVPTDVFSAQTPTPCESTVFTAGSSHQGQNQDQDMGNICDDGKQGPPIAMSSFDSEKSTSPIPETPGLTYSPSSTDCSSGSDRTIQMSTFEDIVFPPVNGSQLWLDHVDPRCVATRTASPVSQVKGNCLYDKAFILDLARVNNVVSVVESETMCGSQYLWREDSRYISLEAAGVH